MQLLLLSPHAQNYLRLMLLVLLLPSAAIVLVHRYISHQDHWGHEGRGEAGIYQYQIYQNSTGTCYTPPRIRP